MGQGGEAVDIEEAAQNVAAAIDAGATEITALTSDDAEMSTAIAIANIVQMVLMLLEIGFVVIVALRVLL